MAELVLNVHDTTGAVLNVVDGVAITHRVLRGPVEVTAEPGGGGTTMPSGTAGQVPQVQSGSTYELVTPNTPNGLVRLDGDGTIPDNRIPSTIARDSEVSAAISGKADVSHTHSASDITSGTMATARLGSGAANSSTFLRGDQTYATPTVDVVSNVATSRILGRITAGSGDSEELTAADVKTLLGITAAVVGGQDEGPVVTGTAAATLLDGTVTLSGAAGDAWDIVAAGRWNNQSGSTGAPRIVLRIGGVDVFTYAPTATASNAADRLWRLEATIRAESTTDLNISAVGYYLTGLIVLGGTSSGDVGTGAALDIQGFADAGTPKEVQLTQLTVVRSKATA